MEVSAFRNPQEGKARHLRLDADYDDVISFLIPWKYALESFLQIQPVTIRFVEEMTREDYKMEVIAYCNRKEIVVFMDLLSSHFLARMTNFLPSLNTYGKQLVFILAHEMVHAKQHQEGRIEINNLPDGNFEHIWNKLPFDFRTVTQYFDLPWEHEANEIAERFVLTEMTDGRDISPSLDAARKFLGLKRQEGSGGSYGPDPKGIPMGMAEEERIYGNSGHRKRLDRGSCRILQSAR